MAKRRFIVAIGQSQSSCVGDAPSWEDRHPNVALRSPLVTPQRAPQYSEGAHLDTIELPYTFPGGRRGNRFGDGQALGLWQYASCRGRAVQAIRYLTFYNPVASKLNVGSTSTTTYPGIASIIQGSTPSRINTSMLWQYDPVGMKLTRRRTGVVHTVQAGWAGVTSLLDISPPMIPAPEIYEQFEYEILGGGASSTATVRLVPQFGGLHDIGSQLDQPAASGLGTALIAGQHLCDLRRIRDAAGVNLVGRVICRSRPVYVGHPVAFTGAGLPTGVVAGTTYYVSSLCQEEEVKFIPSWNIGTGELDWITQAHGLADGETIRLTGGTLPPELAYETDYFVRVVNEKKVQLSATYGGAAIAFSSSPTGVSLIRMDGFAMFTIAATPGGADLVFDADSPAFTLGTVQESFRGSMTGIVIRCTEGANAGAERTLVDMDYVAAPVSAIGVSPDWDNAPQAGDKYVIEPPSVGGVKVPWDKWAMWLPWSPFEGSAHPTIPYPVQILSPAPSVGTGKVVVTNKAPQKGSVVRFYTSGKLPHPLIPGRRYFVQDSQLGSIYLSNTYGGPALVGTDGGLGTGVHTIVVLDQENKSNPYPPGFNFPNQSSLPGIYQAYDGATANFGDPKVGHHTGFGLLLHDFFGEPIDIVECAFGGTSLAHKEVMPTDLAYSFGWVNVRQQLSWAPGEPDGCFARFLDVLDAMRIAYSASGDEGECIAVTYAQGEEDARFEEFANHYGDNARRLRKAVREAIAAAGFWKGDPSRIPWIHPRMKRSVWPYIDTVNDAVTDYIREDPFSGTFDTEDLPVMPDGVHYNGSALTDFADREFEVLKRILKVGSEDITVCNLALSNIGETARVTSISPPDGSAQADLCAQFFPVARDGLLERHPWDFAMRRKALVAVDSDRSDWAYAYEIPDEVLAVINVVAEAPTNDVSDNGSRTGQPFTIGIDIDGAKLLYTNVENARIEFVSRVIDSARWSPAFKKALAWELASMLAGPIIKGEEGAKAATNAIRMAEVFVPRARMLDTVRTRRPNQTHDLPPWIKGR